VEGLYDELYEDASVPSQYLQCLSDLNDKKSDHLPFRMCVFSVKGNTHPVAIYGPALLPESADASSRQMDSFLRTIDSIPIRWKYIVNKFV